jgi:RNA polymerase sigma-70 factor (ECF subfamily)
MPHEAEAQPIIPPAQWFTTTHWSVVLTARRIPSPQSEAALEKLCRSYWYPLYAYIRRQGHNPDDAQDLTQSFFTRFLEHNYLESVERDKGKFRSFLLACLNHFLSNERDRANAAKRGSGKPLISLDDETAEEKYQLEPASTLTPAMIYERRWALTVLETALERLRIEFVQSGREEQFNRLKSFLEGGVGRGEYDLAAADLRVSSSAVAMAVHRLRGRYREMIREEVANTVSEPGEIDAEMRHLLTVLAS